MLLEISIYCAQLLKIQNVNLCFMFSLAFFLYKLCLPFLIKNKYFWGFFAHTFTDVQSYLSVKLKYLTECQHSPQHFSFVFHVNNFKTCFICALKYAE